MNPQTEIKELVLSFFDMIGSTVSFNDSIYNISVPEQYHNHFLSHKLAITFDENTASDHNCELVIVGSRTLSAVLKICMSKAPISFRKISGVHNQTILRYHFFVNFSSMHNMPNLVHVDIDMNTCKPTILKHNPKYVDTIPVMTIEPKNLTSSYTAALDELTKKYASARTKFIENANAEFQQDFESAMIKYDDQIREIDNSINKKEQESNNLEKTQEFRFKCIKNIRKLESEKATVAQTLQEKHQINLTYNLIACEIIQIHT